MRQERGISLVSFIIVLVILGVVGLAAAKLMPSYIEYFQVKKVFASMKQAGDLNGSPREIRASFDRRNAIEDMKSLTSKDLELTKVDGETVMNVAWSVKIPLVYNASACLDFAVSSADIK